MPDAAELSEYFLRTEGYDVATALDAIQARLQFEERPPDLVVLDRLISGGAGFRLCSEFAARVGTRARITRSLTVLKTRASRHEPEVRTYEIWDQGIVLGGSPVGSRPPSRGAQRPADRNHGVAGVGQPHGPRHSRR